MPAKTNASDYSPPNVNYWGDRCCKAEAEIERLREWLGCIERLTDDEIGARFRTSSHKSEREMAKGSVIYTMLQMPRDLARRALAGDPFVLPAPDQQITEQGKL